jgi:anti-sigma factor RsiW
MTDQGKNGFDAWEERINALLDGELDPAEAQALKSEATRDQRLAAAIVEAYQLQRAMEHVRVERAPASLRRKLRRIPGQHRPLYLQPRWAAALAAVPLLVISMVLLQPREPSQAEIDKARQELAIAFAYIDRVSDRALDRIEQEVGGELTDAVGESVMKSIPRHETEPQENRA